MVLIISCVLTVNVLTVHSTFSFILRLSTTYGNTKVLGYHLLIRPRVDLKLTLHDNPKIFTFALFGEGCSLRPKSSIYIIGHYFSK